MIFCARAARSARCPSDIPALYAIVSRGSMPILRDLDIGLKVVGLVDEHKARQIVAERILLPVDEMLLRLNLQRVTQDRRPAMRSRSQSDDLRSKADVAVVAVGSAMG
jgi:hypothetical protein